MGESKKIDVDISAVLKKATEMYPALKAAAALEKTGITDAMSEINFVKFSDIKKAANCSVSATCNFLAAAVKAGIVEKDPAGPLYRLGGYFETRNFAIKIMSNSDKYPLTRAEVRVRTLIRSAAVFAALWESDKCLGEIQEATGLSQSAASLKMSRLVSIWWVDRERDGKKIYFSLPDSTRRVLVAMAGAM